MQSADYVVVGGGSAGAAIAARLSEDPTAKIALLEAGGEAGGLIVQLPAGYAKMIGNPKYDWAYSQDPDPSIGGGSRSWSNGKLLGGGSSVNGQVYIRGTRRDYDRWAEAGATGWGFDDVWPYFLRSEIWQGEPSQVHGAHGPLTVGPLADCHPLCGAFLQGCAELGMPVLAEHNGGEMDGAFLTQTNQRNGWRCSTEKAYLRPARSRRNLQIITHASVRRIICSQGRTVAVEYAHKNGPTLRIEARREVILSAGAIGSPAILLRSGIGPGAELAALGIPVIHDLPQVGQNLQEHCHAGIARAVTAPTLTSKMSPFAMLGFLYQFISRRAGPLGSPAVQAMALARTRPGIAEPDVQLHFFPLGFDNGGNFEIYPMPAVTICASRAHPDSRGRVRLDSSGEPHIAHQLIGDERDQRSLVDALKLIDRLYDTPAMRALMADDGSFTRPRSDAEWVRQVQRTAACAYHPAGTCRMGSDDQAVVDPKLRLRGIAGLRVADASVMPLLPSTNTNAPVIMIAERAAAFIRQEA